MKFLLGLLLVLNLSVANAKVKYLEQGQKSPYAGFLLDEEAQLYVNQVMATYEAQRSALVRQNDMLINVQKQKVELEYERDLLAQENSSSKFWTKVLWFVGGALVGGAVVRNR